MLLGPILQLLKGKSNDPSQLSQGMSIQLSLNLSRCQIRFASNKSLRPATHTRIMSLHCFRLDVYSSLIETVKMQTHGFCQIEPPASTVVCLFAWLVGWLCFFVSLFFCRFVCLFAEWCTQVNLYSLLVLWAHLCPRQHPAPAPLPRHCFGLHPRRCKPCAAERGQRGPRFQHGAAL